MHIKLGKGAANMFGKKIKRHCLYLRIDEELLWAATANYVQKEGSRAFQIK